MDGRLHPYLEGTWEREKEERDKGRESGRKGAVGGGAVPHFSNKSLQLGPHQGRLSFRARKAPETPARRPAPPSSSARTHERSAARTHPPPRSASARPLPNRRVLLGAAPPPPGPLPGGVPEGERPQRRERRDADGEGFSAGGAHPVAAAIGGGEGGVLAVGAGRVMERGGFGRARGVWMGMGRAIRVTGGSSAVGRMRARGRAVRAGHRRETVSRATRPVSAAERDVAPDGPMSMDLGVSFQHVYE